MAKILMIHDKYNWDSYSIVRSAVEILKERGLYIPLTEGCWDKLSAGDYVWIYSSRYELLDYEYQELKNRGLKIVTFGLSDPNMFDERRMVLCDVYCTNDLRTAQEYNVYHFPVGVDLKRFRPMDMEKDSLKAQIEVLFVGTLSHPYIPCRKPYLLALRKDSIIKFEGYGEGFNFTLEGEDLVEAYNRAQLNLDICTKYSSLGSRIFQAAACGVPTLTLKREDVLQCFEDGKEILTYEGGYKEMKLAILRAGRENLKGIGEAARQRCLKDHGMRKRIDDLITYLGESNEK